MRWKKIFGIKKQVQLKAEKNIKIQSAKIKVYLFFLLNIRILKNISDLLSFLENHIVTDPISQNKIA